MPMTLVFKRAKSFVHVASGPHGGSKKFLAQAGPANPVPVPFWVAETATYKQGIKDGSIVNLTPPQLMPGYVYPEAAPEPVDAVPGTLGGAEAASADDVEQEEVPQAPFGGQPMTPVPPAPKVGRVSSSTKKTQ